MPCQYINLCQSKEERQRKYWLCRSLGVNSYWAAAMRDWRITKIERFFGLDLPPVMQVLIQLNSAPAYGAEQKVT